MRRGLFERNISLVLSQPLVERLQGGIQRARLVEIARPAEDRLEVTFELEHLAEILTALLEDAEYTLVAP
ncbi:MAG: hypothetical protein Q8L74_02220 [Nitrospirota bacterium]|nr:hypothetical protein [Nitrospirota bacterium]MDP2382262.1 hypothetical protein [Nitrospirota bacterium]MDP3599332.1 hypothetical protein [Nitrospirota bacterium]